MIVLRAYEATTRTGVQVVRWGITDESDRAHPMAVVGGMVRAEDAEDMIVEHLREALRQPGS